MATLRKFNLIENLIILITLLTCAVDGQSVKGKLPTIETCGKSTTYYNSKSGSAAGLGEYPWVVRLAYKSRYGQFYCSGTLITDRHVLTSAECVIQKRYKLSQVHLGEHNTLSDPDCNNQQCFYPVLKMDVKDIIVHDEFRGTKTDYHNNIAIIVLKTGVLITDFVRPICLPTAVENFTDSRHGDRNFLSGWGVTKPLGEMETEKQQIEVSIFDHDNCTQMYANEGLVIEDSEICAVATGAVDICQGFSGAPLMKNVGNTWFLEGMLSCGRGCGDKQWPGVYTRLQSFDNWIKKQINSCY